MRRVPALLLVLAVAATAALAAPLAASDGQAAPTRSVRAVASLERGVLAEVNALRRRHGLAPLRLNASLSAAADGHSRSMALRGFFGHDSADGSPFWQRVKRHYGSKGFPYWSVGENLVWAAPELSARTAVQMWLSSPPHRKNLLTPRWREIGLSAVRAEAAPGVFDGLDVVIVTADFGVRR
jgi:uncharacterized protein YkwD